MEQSARKGVVNWLSMLHYLGAEHAVFIQEDVLDAQNRTLKIEIVNEALISKVEIREKCCYYAHPRNPNWTCFEQMATANIKKINLNIEHCIKELEDMVEIGVKQYIQFLLKGREIIEFFIKKLKSEGVAYDSPETDGSPSSSEPFFALNLLYNTFPTNSQTEPNSSSEWPVKMISQQYQFDENLIAKLKGNTPHLFFNIFKLLRKY